MEVNDGFSHKLRNNILVLSIKINKSLYIAVEIVKAKLSSSPSYKILFSVKPVWEKNIIIGFKTLNHTISFQEFTTQNIIENDIVVPLTISDLNFFNAHLPTNRKLLLPIPSNEALNICNDKFLFYETLMVNGFGKFLPQIGSNLSRPFILKKRVAEDGDDCYIISTADQENKVKELLNDPEFFCQKIIPGKREFATHILFKDGKILKALNIEYVFDTALPIKGKNEYICRKISACSYLDIFKNILLSIRFEGLCCFNYKVEDDIPYIFEINPRFGGSLSSFFFSFIKTLK